MQRGEQRYSVNPFSTSSLKAFNEENFQISFDQTVGDITNYRISSNSSCLPSSASIGRNRVQMRILYGLCAALPVHVMSWPLLYHTNMIISAAGQTKGISPSQRCRIVDCSFSVCPWLNPACLLVLPCVTFGNQFGFGRLIKDLLDKRDPSACHKQHPSLSSVPIN